MAVLSSLHCVKSVQIRIIIIFLLVHIFPYLDYIQRFIILLIQSNYGKIRTRKIPYSDIFRARNNDLLELLDGMKFFLLSMHTQAEFSDNLFSVLERLLGILIEPTL